MVNFSINSILGVESIAPSETSVETDRSTSSITEDLNDEVGVIYISIN